VFRAGVPDEFVPNASGTERGDSFTALLWWNDVVLLADEQ
jgi:hypothetical protein